MAAPPQLTWQNIVATLALLLTAMVAGWRLVQNDFDSLHNGIKLLSATIEHRLDRLERESIRRDEFDQFQKRMLERK